MLDADPDGAVGLGGMLGPTPACGGDRRGRVQGLSVAGWCFDVGSVDLGGELAGLLADLPGGQDLSVVAALGAENVRVGADNDPAFAGHGQVPAEGAEHLGLPIGTDRDLLDDLRVEVGVSGAGSIVPSSARWGPKNSCPGWSRPAPRAPAGKRRSVGRVPREVFPMGSGAVWRDRGAGRVRVGLDRRAVPYEAGGPPPWKGVRA